jgi:hypothetical protein
LTRFVCGVAGLTAVIGLAGCGGGDGFARQPVSGTVAYKGKPVVYGKIEFSPAEGQNTPLALEIKDGKFAADKSNGLSAGKYVVRIEGFDAAPPPPADAPGNPTGPQPKMIIPAKYGAQSQETVEIKAGDKNELKYDLQ